MRKSSFLQQCCSGGFPQVQQRDAAPTPQAEAFCPPGNSPSGRHWAPEKPVQRAGTYSAFIFI